MSNIGLFSTSNLIATDSTLNGNLTVAESLTIHGTMTLTSFNLSDIYTLDQLRQCTIEETIVTNSCVWALGNYVFFGGYTTITSYTATSGYNLTDKNNDRTLVSPYALANKFSMYYGPNGKCSANTAGYYLITGQLVFGSNTAGNKWVLNKYDSTNALLPDETIVLCQLPVSYTTEFVVPINAVVYFNLGESFSIALENFQGSETLLFTRRNGKTSFKILLLS